MAESARYETRLEKANKTLRGQIFKMPVDTMGIMLYLTSMEDTFNACQIDLDLRLSILKANLNEKARNACMNMSLGDKANFQDFKAALLRIFCVTPMTCRHDFMTATRQANESHGQFAHRLRILFGSYLESRFVTDLPNLIELFLSDRLKETLSTAQRAHVGDNEQDSG